MSLTVAPPPLMTADLPKVGGVVGPEPEDFCVDEVALYELSGSGDHRYLRIRKRELTTLDVVKVLSKATSIRDRDIGYAGLKDKHAITTQWFSLPDLQSRPSPKLAVLSEPSSESSLEGGLISGAHDSRGASAPTPSVALAWGLPDSIQVLEWTRHENKLRTGHLWGNRFRIHLVGAAPDTEEDVAAITHRLRTLGLWNFFGAQRFGHEGRNLANALEALLSPGRARLTRFQAKFYPSVVQAEIFNRYLVRRIGLGLDRLFAGETVRIVGSKKTFLVEDPGAEHQRLLRGEIQLTGPVLGSKSRLPEGKTREIALEVLTELGLSLADLERYGDLAPGSVRDLKVPVEDLKVSRAGSPDVWVLEFSLPAGSFATQLMREFTGSDFLSGSRSAGNG